MLAIPVEEEVSEDPQHTLRLKIVAIGDGGVGKTCLLKSFAKRHFENFSYVSRRWSSNIKERTLTIDDRTLELNVWDTPGQEDYDRLRPLSYPDTHIGLACFSLVNPGSFANVEERWVPEFRHYCPEQPFLLVGLKADLRTDERELEYLQRSGQTPVTTSQAVKVAIKCGAAAYVECSSICCRGVDQLFALAAGAGCISPVDNMPPVIFYEDGEPLESREDQLIRFRDLDQIRSPLPCKAMDEEDLATWV
ncbi:GTP-binding protein Rho1 [Rhizophlyctis rosea]|nr:GTP-binding protein Rho1 [Rhizophlyctis rosea]